MTGVVIVIFVLWGEEAQSYTELHVSHKKLSTLEQNRVIVLNQSKGFEFHIVELKSSRGYDCYLRHFQSPEKIIAEKLPP